MFWDQRVLPVLKVFSYTVSAEFPPFFKFSNRSKMATRRDPESDWIRDLNAEL